MATGQDLRHDFAPAWLKLPNHEVKQPMVKSGERSLNDRSARVGWYGGVSRGHASVEDHSYSQQYRRRFHSTDHYTDFNSSSVGDGHWSRMKHNGHGSRFHEQVNGTASDPYVNNGPRSPLVAGSYSSAKKLPYQEARRSGSVSEVPRSQRRHPESARDGGSVVSSLDDEFPSLNGDSNLESKKPAANKVLTVWDSPCREPTCHNRSLGSNGTETSHKALVLKTGLSKRSGHEGDRGSVGSSVKPLTSPGIPKTVSTSTSRDSSKESAPVDVLSTCLVKQPKNLVDKKSSFLRALRSECDEAHQDLNASHIMPLENGTSAGDVIVSETCGNVADDAPDRLNNGDVFLPDFNETEYRLLLEMGWKEPADDEDGYEITEADVKEFENLCRQLEINKLKCAMAPQRNGFTKTSGVLSASRMSTFMAGVPLSCLDTCTDESSDSSGDGDVCPH